MTYTSRDDFEAWALPILGDNPTWRESGDCEIAWQSWQASRKAKQAMESAREYLATEPSGERAELIAELRERHGKRFVVSPSMFSRAADMLEADAQQAKRMTDDQIQEIYIRTYNIGHHGRNFENAFARAIEAHHGITEPADKPTGWDNGLSQDYCAEFGQWLASRPGARQQIKAMFDEPEEEDLYALALKADNWGQP